MKTNSKQLKKSPFTKKVREILHFNPNFRFPKCKRILVVSRCAVDGVHFETYHNLSVAKYICKNMPDFFKDAVNSNVFEIGYAH